MTNANNVTPITDKQPQPQCRFSIQATLRGFPITIEGEGRAGDLKLIVDRLLSIGAEPPSPAKPEPTKAAGTPACPDHPGRKMKASTARPGTFFCTASVGQAEDGRTVYCTKKA